MKNFVRTTITTLLIIIFSMPSVFADTETVKPTPNVESTPNVTSYRDLLDERQQYLYDDIYKRIEEGNDCITMLPKPFYVDEFKTIANSIVADNTDYFCGTFGIQYTTLKRSSNNIRTFKIVLPYDLHNDYFKKYEISYIDNRGQLIEKIKKLKTKEEKIKYIHDYICDNTEYCHWSNFNQYTFSVYVCGKSVCAGYAKTFKDLCNAVGIECYYIIGYVRGDYTTPHAWNVIVDEDGSLHFYDVTWDDTENDKEYTYYDKTLEEMEELDNHELGDLSIKLINSIKNRKELENEV